MCTIFNAVIMSLFLPAVYPHSWTTQQGLELSHRARLEHDDEDDECVDLGGWQVEPRIVRIASIRLGESNSSSALGLESEFCDKPGNSYFCWGCSANKMNNTAGKGTKDVVGFMFVSSTENFSYGFTGGVLLLLSIIFFLYSSTWMLSMSIYIFTWVPLVA